jgi:hypothetical protein
MTHTSKVGSQNQLSNLPPEKLSLRFVPFLKSPLLFLFFASKVAPSVVLFSVYMEDSNVD